MSPHNLIALTITFLLCITMAFTATATTTATTTTTKGAISSSRTGFAQHNAPTSSFTISRSRRTTPSTTTTTTTTTTMDTASRNRLQHYKQQQMQQQQQQQEQRHDVINLSKTAHHPDRDAVDRRHHQLNDDSSGSDAAARSIGQRRNLANAPTTRLRRINPQHNYNSHYSSHHLHPHPHAHGNSQPHHGHHPRQQHDLQRSRGRVGGGGAGAGAAAGNRRNDWSYHTYNVQSNTFGAPPPSFHPSSNHPSGNTNTNRIGKGDDNTLDVEFIGNDNTNWSLSSHPHITTEKPKTTSTTTQLPPPLVPARRGYPTVAPPSSNELSPVTDDPYTMTNIIHRKANTPNDPKEMERRHICVQQRTITMPVKTTEVYVRPMWKHVSTPCQPPTYNPNQMCTRVQLVHEQAYRDVIRHKSAQHVTFDCCTGWMRETPHADACLKPVCATHCQNGGTCSGPDTCTCPAGFSGRYCEHDINECKEEKPCDQTCINTVGSYYCRCRHGFVLQADQQSCKKIKHRDDDAFEARDLENDIDTNDDDDDDDDDDDGDGEHDNDDGDHNDSENNETENAKENDNDDEHDHDRDIDRDDDVRVRNNDVTARLHKIERSLANERIQTHELQKSLQQTYHVVDTLKIRLTTLEKQQHDLNRLQTNLYDTETRTNKLEGMVNLLMKCRNGPNANCP